LYEKDIEKENEEFQKSLRSRFMNRSGKMTFLKTQKNTFSYFF